ncbi:class I SAM-dependent methyltransferase [Patulibacter americanus]|uniref:class I SAM-dependent methyltransferase n=1 Tax=Patulibacter americanus TaxID=588672 RepID=UPI0003B5D072|nr:class I SAM-dependent methyltransferase [Patulibacter americanus]
MSVCEETVLGGRRRVVELGSGTSTVLLAHPLREQGRGCALDAVEHHAGWRDRVNEMLADEHLASSARETLVPLASHPHGRDGLPGYAQGALADVLEGTPVKALIFNGPPAFEPGDALARYPAPPAYLPKLAPDSVVVLDDVICAGEADIVDRWEALSAFYFDRRAHEDIAFRPGAGFGLSGPAPPPPHRSKVPRR